MARKTKVQRRQARVSRRRSRRSDWEIRDIRVADAVVGPDMAVPAFDEVLRAIEHAPRGDDWDAVRRIVIPVFPRARPQPPGYPEDLTVVLPPGVVVGFGADIGPAFMRMNAAQLEILGISQADLVAASLANLLSRAAQVEAAAVVDGEILDTRLRVIQSGLSIGSALVLVPDELRRLLGPTPSLLVAPMRDLLIAFPPDVDIDLAAWVFSEFASQDPNCLSPVAFRFDGEGISTASLGRVAPAAARRRLA